MLKRKVLNDLKKWKDNHKNECLMVLGARQIGKTYIIRKFANDNYDNVLEINFLERPECKEIFDGNLDSVSILKKISLRFSQFKLEDNKTLIFFDEIQDCPNAITALKFLAQDSRFDTIVSGSMLGMTYKRVTSFPVGYVDRIYMNSLDFEEFLWAKGVSEEAISYLKSDFLKRKQVSMSTHDRMM